MKIIFSMIIFAHHAQNSSPEEIVTFLTSVWKQDVLKCSILHSTVNYQKKVAFHYCKSIFSTKYLENSMKKLLRSGARINPIPKTQVKSLMFPKDVGEDLFPTKV